jgi:class 3 adenylate cyclase
MARTETVTVVFADLVGSTELASRLGHDAYEVLRHEHFNVLRTAVVKYGPLGRLRPGHVGNLGGTILIAKWCL